MSQRRLPLALVFAAALAVLPTVSGATCQKPVESGGAGGRCRCADDPSGWENCSCGPYGFCQDCEVSDRCGGGAGCDELGCADQEYGLVVWTFPEVPGQAEGSRAQGLAPVVTPDERPPSEPVGSVAAK